MPVNKLSDTIEQCTENVQQYEASVTEEISTQSAATDIVSVSDNHAFGTTLSNANQDFTESDKLEKQVVMVLEEQNPSMETLFSSTQKGKTTEATLKKQEHESCNSKLTKQVFDFSKAFGFDEVFDVEPTSSDVDTEVVDMTISSSATANDIEVMEESYHTVKSG